MRLRLRAGRLLDDRDTAASQPVLVVNRSFAEQYLGEDPIGRRLPLSLYRQAEWEIVGVVEDMKQGGLETAGIVRTDDAAQPEIFSPYRQFGEMRPSSIFFVARTDGDPAAIIPALRALVRERAPALVVESIMTMEDRVAASLARPRAYALVLSAFAMSALAIAAVGLFGVLSTASRSGRAKLAFAQLWARERRTSSGSCSDRRSGLPPPACVPVWSVRRSWRARCRPSSSASRRSIRSPSSSHRW